MIRLPYRTAGSVPAAIHRRTVNWLTESRVAASATDSRSSSSWFIGDLLSGGCAMRLPQILRAGTDVPDGRDHQRWPKTAQDRV